ncbi:MAG TPA: NF038122 family metalloprotease [Pyrinomonadaceae bacterium]|nr:NF038122 family metalloprotease [Pyrinomonadaceae bacterium]
MNLQYRTPLALSLVFAIFLTSLGLTASVQAQTSSASTNDDKDYFLLYQDSNGDTICREANAAEKTEIEKYRPKNLRQVNHLEMNALSAEPQTDNDGTHLTIILRATAALDANAPAKAAFVRAAEAWEAVIHSSATIYLDADLSSDGFGAGVLGSTSSPSQTFSYGTVRNTLLNGASPAKQAVYNLLPTNSVPIDISPGTSSNVSVSSSIARSIGLLNPTAQPSDNAANIRFNSTFGFDFDPSDGITSNTTDFEAVATHEIGHALGFTSRSGGGGTTLAMWDLYRFRSGTTDGTFTSAQRIMSAGGPVDNPLQFYFVPGQSELGLSTGGPNGTSDNNGDGNQSSHWKQSSLNGGVLIGIMDPRIPRGVHRTISSNDTNALDIFGYNSTAPPPITAPPNDNFASAQTISGCSGTTTGTNLNATKETNEPNHSPDNNGGTHSIWYQWQAPSSGPAQVTTAGSGFDTVLAVYTGGSVDALAPLVKNDDVNPGVVTTSIVSFNAVGGATYRIAVDGYNNTPGSGGDVGPVTLNWAINGCDANFVPATLSASQVEFKNWTINGETFIYVKLNFPTAGYRVASWGTPFANGPNSFAVNANVEVFNGAVAQVLTNTAQIYSLGALAPGAYTFTFQNFGTPVKTHNFTVSATAPPANPIDDPRTFVRQQYLDFLRREPDGPGWDHWTAEITMCSDAANRFAGETEPQCVERKRANTSAAFFLSPEFSNTGYFVLRVYRGSLGRMPHFGGDTTPSSEFTRDAATVSANIVVNNALSPAQINANKQAFVNEFVTRGEFQSIYGALNNTQYVDKLFQTTGVTPSAAERQALIDGLGNGGETRASVLFKVVDGTNTITDGALQFQTTYGKAFYDNLFNAAFVQMEYFGYLQRDPDDAGYNFWLGKLNQFGNWVDAQMVLAFIKSPEYRSRFGAP